MWRLSYLIRPAGTAVTEASSGPRHLQGLMDFPEDPRVRLQHVAGFIVAAGVIALIFGAIMYTQSMYADSFWQGSVTPPDVRNAIDDGLWRGRILMVTGLMLAAGAWIWSVYLEHWRPRFPP